MYAKRRAVLTRYFIPDPALLTPFATAFTSFFFCVKVNTQSHRLFSSRCSHSENKEVVEESDGEQPLAITASLTFLECVYGMLI